MVDTAQEYFSKVETVGQQSHDCRPTVLVSYSANWAIEVIQLDWCNKVKWVNYSKLTGFQWSALLGGLSQLGQLGDNIPEYRGCQGQYSYRWQDQDAATCVDALLDALW